MSSSVYTGGTTIAQSIVPALVTVLLHVGMVFLMAVNWSPDEREVIKVKPAPKAITARLVDVSEFKPQPKPQPKPRTKPAPTRVAKPAPKPAPKPQPAPARTKPKVEAKPEPKPKPEPRITQQELAAIARAELADTLDREDTQEATATGDEMVASFSALIQNTVINYWSRPPSARNGMETELSIQLIPTGEVVSVQIVRSSGNTAFDRSAVNAVNKAGAFPELQKLPNKEFEKNFRRFRLLFRPEDLRY